jgi:uracil-DNA glycosylase family 4
MVHASARDFQIRSSKTSIDNLSASIRACLRCADLVKSRSQAVPGAGAIPAEVAFVGLAPGRFGGDRTGVPFDGDRSGELLRRMIRHAGLESVFITNVVRCNPRDAAGRNRDPTASEIANCRGYLAAEMKLARPRLVVCLGRVAWRELAGRDRPFTPGAAKPAIVRKLRLWPMYHPGYVIRGAYPEKSYRRDFARMARIVHADHIGRPD